MKLHNTLTRSVDQFTPQKNNWVSMYSCGPTVYNYLHVGNWASYIRWDVLARTLRRHYGLDWYMNITDVGHLVSDADDGEDKLEKGARREGKTAWEVAEFYTEDFKHGLDYLNISIDKHNLTKATDHITEQIALIKQLEEKGYTYIIDDGVYFDSTAFKEYGKMARLDVEGLQGGARVDLGQKKHATDFALWKFSPKDEQRDMEWESPWGTGFPGWHIECSAMAMKYLGESIDIHTGGIDHIPIHHTNEIAQSEAATGQKFVNFWLHSNFLQIDGTKISKSLGNTYTLQDLAEKDFGGQDLRMLILQSHFQTEANFTWEGMQAAQQRRKELQAFADLRFQFDDNGIDLSAQLTAATVAVKTALDENLNTPKALAEISSIIALTEGRKIATQSKQVFNELLKTIDNHLGFRLLASEDINEHQKHTIKNRLDARNNKDWALSDTLRDELAIEGLAVKDTPNGTIWQRTITTLL